MEPGWELRPRPRSARLFHGTHVPKYAAERKKGAQDRSTLGIPLGSLPIIVIPGLAGSCLRQSLYSCCAIQKTPCLDVHSLRQLEQAIHQPVVHDGSVATISLTRLRFRVIGFCMGLYKVHPPYSHHHPRPGFVPGLVRCQGPTVAPGCPRTPALQCLLFFADPNRSFKDKHAGLDRTCHPCTSPLGRASFWSLPTEPATMHPVRKRTKGKKACPAFPCCTS